MIQNFITQLSNQLKSNDYYERFPQLLDTSNKTHVLFLGPYKNATGLYRTILPYKQLNQTKTHLAIITNLMPWPTKTSTITWRYGEELMKWADYVVFPTVTEPINDIIADFKKINTKPHLKFVIDVDDNYHIPSHHENPELAQKSRKALLDNMLQCNIINCSSKQLGLFYQDLLQKQKINEERFINITPNYMTKDIFENIKITDPKPNKTRIGIILNQKQAEDIKPLTDALKQVNKKYKNKVEIVLFGWSARRRDDNNKSIVYDFLPGVKRTFVDAVSIDQYFNKLANLQLDMALMPLLDNTFNNCKTYHKLLQYAQMGVPCIVSNVLPYNEIISPTSSIFEPGYLPALKVNKPEDWIKNIDFLIENESTRKNIGEKAKEYVNQTFMIEDRPSFYASIFNKIAQ